MITDLNELLIRLQVHFEEADHGMHHEPDQPPHPLPYALLSAIDLVEEIQRHLSRADADKITLNAVVRAWHSSALPMVDRSPRHVG